MHPKPQAEHQRLDFLVGTWDIDITFWARPGEPPSRSRGFSVIERLFGGLFLQERVEGLLGEAPFVSLTWYGFDPQRQRYQAARIASTRADRVDESGRFDETGALVLESEGERPAGRIRTVLRPEGPDRLVLERFLVPPTGEPWRTSVIRYVRRPA